MRKWRFYMILGLLVLLVSSGLSMAAETRSSFSVNSNKSKVLVNGSLTNFEAYNIDGFNYFKLRDIALVVSGTNKQFNVAWDGSVGAINLLTGNSYVADGSELATGDGSQKTAFFNSSSIYKDGKRVILGAFTINGNNFFKLRDLCQAFNIGVTWDATSATIGVDTSISYIVPPKAPVWITPNNTDDFDNVISPAGEGYFTGLRAKSLDSWDYVLTIYDDALKPILKTNYNAEAYSGFNGPVFSNGLMAVTTATQKEAGSDYYGVDLYKYAYIDTAGNVIIPEKYFSVSAFTYGLACVHEMSNGEIYTLLIDTTGKVVWSQKGNLDAVFGGDGQVRFWPTNEYVTFPENVLARHSGHWDYNEEWVETKNLTSVETANAVAFRSTYGDLYGNIETLGYGYYKVETTKEPVLQAIVDQNNKIIVPKSTYDTLEMVYTDTSICFMIVKNADDIFNGRTVYNSSGTKILTNVHQVYFAGGEAIYYFQLDANGDSTYGLIETSGIDIVPLGYMYLTAHDPYNGIHASYSELMDPGAANTRIYTAGNLQERADTTDLKKVLAIAQDIYYQAGAIQDPEYRDRNYTNMARFINRAKALIAMDKPTWIDVSVTEAWLGLTSSYLYIAP